MFTLTHLYKHPLTTITHLLNHHHHRTFIAAKIKWVRDPYLDNLVSREKNLVQCLTLKNIILSYPPSSPPSLSTISLSKPTLNLPSSTTTLSFFLKYPSLFTLPPQITPPFLTLHHEELALHSTPSLRSQAAQRLCKFLMITRAFKLPIPIINDFLFDLGLPLNYLIDLVPFYPELFRVCSLEYNGRMEIGLELVQWRPEFAKPAVSRDFDDGWCRKVRFRMSFAPGFDLQKRVLEYVEMLQDLPYVSPYENAFHLEARGDHAEKWVVSVLHEIMSVLISKKTEMRNVLRLGEYLGFGMRFKKVVMHYPGIFYVSNKIRTQTVVLREGFRKDVLLERNPLMGMRHRYIYLMSKSRKRRKFVRGVNVRNSVEVNRSGKGVGRIVEDDEGETDMESDEELERSI